MTPALHARFNARLARALGYTASSVKISGNYCLVDYFNNGGITGWRVLDYQSPEVVMPLIDWLGDQQVSLAKLHDTPQFMKWHAVYTHDIVSVASAATLSKAVALAVIAVRKCGIKKGSEGARR